MKSILKIILAFIFVPLLLVSCDDDDVDPIIEASDLRLVDPGINQVSLNINTPDQNAFLITWDDYSTDTSADYTIQASDSESFENVADLGSTSENHFTYSMQNLNDLLLGWNYTPYVPKNVHLRVVSGAMVSNAIKFLVQTYPVERAVISSPQANEQIDLDVNLEEEVAYTFAWNDYAYDDGDAEVAYELQFALPNTDFTEVQEFNAYEAMRSLTHAELNEVAMELGLEPEEVGELAVRVITTVNAPSGEELTFTSDAVTFRLLTYTPTDPKLFVVGSIQGYYGASNWTPEEGLELRYIGDGTTQLFEGYLRIGADDQFKLVDAQVGWGDLTGNYGTIDNAQDGNLQNSGGSSNIAPGEEGFYYLRVDIDNLTYQLVKMDWGIIGNATPNGWNGETSMTFNFDANQYEWSGDLNDGELKFRSMNTGQAIYNSDWSFNIGNDQVAWDVGSGNISITAGSFDVTLSIDVQGNAAVNGF